MSKYVYFAASLIAATLTWTSMALGQPLTSEECRQMVKGLSNLAPSGSKLEEALPKLDAALKDKLLPRTSDQLRATTISAMQANQELLPVVRKFFASIDALSSQLQLCADANSTLVKSSDANTSPTIAPAPKDDLKGAPASALKQPAVSTPITTVEKPIVRAGAANVDKGQEAPNAAPNIDPAVTGNSAHDRVNKLPKAEQAALLGKAIPCTGIDAFFMGMGPEREAFWSLRCTDGRTYAVSLPLKVADGKVVECAVLAAVGAGPCFKKFSGQ